MNRLLAVYFFVISTVMVVAQDKAFQFKDYYPIAQRPYVTSGFGNNDYEEILFDAKPVVYYSILNNIRWALTQEETKPGHAVYVTFQPQIRMYQENSKPVKTPSYKFLFGWQPIIKTSKNNFITLGLETGHYSNGQSMSAFSEEFEDGSPESYAVYRTITDNTNLSDMLNRKSGNFSTNLTKLSFNYRLNKLNKDNRPLQIHSFTASYQLYHRKFFGLFDFGGYNLEDKDIIARHHLEIGYEYTGFLKKIRFTVGQDILLQLGAHPWAEKSRWQTKGIIYPWDSDLGFLIQFTSGFDDYNYRFVDSFNRFSFGVTWDWFTPFVIRPNGQ